jgi:uncharacterized protein DUF6929
MPPSIDIPLSQKKIPLQQSAALNLQKPLQPGRGAFISAASGLVRHRDYFFVVADDELQLGIFSAHDLSGTASPLLPGVLPLAAPARKRVKPDFEVLLLLPPSAFHAHGALLILGSGSTPQRRRGVLLALTVSGYPQPEAPVLLDLTMLYLALEREFGVVNIEGGTLQKPAAQNNTSQSEQLILLQRGNTKQGNAIVSLDFVALYREITNQLSARDTDTIKISAAALRHIQPCDLGSFSGVALGFTDATCLPNQELLALAVAEDTDNAYADGATLASCLCRFDRDNRLIDVVPMAAPAKTEGITVWQAGSSSADTLLAFVTDADDPAVPALLLTATLAAFE